MAPGSGWLPVRHRPAWSDPSVKQGTPVREGGDAGAGWEIRRIEDPTSVREPFDPSEKGVDLS
jgi:hypothetical protein